MYRHSWFFFGFIVSSKGGLSEVEVVVLVWLGFMIVNQLAVYYKATTVLPVILD